MKIKKEEDVLKNKKKIKNRNKTIILTLIFVILMFGIFKLYEHFFKSQLTYIIVNGYVEKTSDTQGIAIKKETILDIDKMNVTVPIIEQDKRTAKGEIVAIYKTKKYEDYLLKIEEMDKEIQTVIKDLPTVYSNEVAYIDNQISALSKEINGINSYIKMQEYKNKIDNLLYKKIITLGEISPAGSKIKELVESRKEFEEDSKISSDSLRSTAAGLVTYKTDGLENEVNIDNILNYSDKEIEKIIEKYGQNTENNYGIKIIDNYMAYIIIKEPIGLNDSYIKEGREYTLKLIDKENINITGSLIKNIKNETNNYCIFKIKNGIENIIDSRIINLEVIWTKTKGMAILTEAIRKDTSEAYDYITIIKGGQYIKIPIEIKISSDSICIIENISKERRKELNITNTDTFSLYDQVVIQE
jgi:hypothetical protein